MDNSKKNVHSSGPLGMLVKSGQIKSIEDDKKEQTVDPTAPNKYVGSYFKSQSGIVFNANELMYVDPKTCEPWLYANRLNDDLGDLNELAHSIKENKQLQPALIKNHPNPHGDIKYEVIFGRRRHEACLRLNIPFLVIKKDLSNLQEAAIYQEQENRLRENVSNYSNAVHYKRLLQDGIFKNEKELALKLNISLSKLYDILAYTKIPADILEKLPNVHQLSNYMAIKIVSILRENPSLHENLRLVTPEIGNKINTPFKLEKALSSLSTGGKKQHTHMPTKIYKSISGIKLFVFKEDHKGTPYIALNKKLKASVNLEDICNHLKIYMEKICEFGTERM